MFKCSCNHTFTDYWQEEWLKVPLELPLEQGLKSIFARQLANDTKCEKCKDGTLKMRPVLYSLPRFLVLYFDTWDENGNMKGKPQVLPLKLDLGEFVSNETKEFDPS